MRSAAMTFRVINFSTEEIRAELGEVKDALAVCDAMAKEGGYTEIWSVVQMVTVYETKLGQPEQTN